MDPARIDNRTLMLSLASVVAIELLGASILGLAPAMETLVFTGSVRLMESVFLLWVIARVGPGLAALGISRSAVLSGIGRGLLWSLGFGLLAAAGAVLLYWAGVPIPTSTTMGVPDSARQLAVFLAVAGLIGPVTEELFFRGILFGFLRRWGFPLALALSTTFFAIAHPFQTLPLTQIVGGILFAVAYEKEGSLLAPITIHVTGNFALFLLALWLRS